MTEETKRMTAEEAWEFALKNGHPGNTAAIAQQLTGSLPYEKDAAWHPGYFSVGNRNPGHWDVFSERRPGYVQQYYAGEGRLTYATPLSDQARERAFCIRGEPGRVLLRDERWDPARPNRERPVREFPSVASCMVWVSATLMAEDGDEPDKGQEIHALLDRASVLADEQSQAGLPESELSRRLAKQVDAALAAAETCIGLSREE